MLYKLYLQEHLPKQKNGLELPLSDCILFRKIVHQINWDLEKNADGQRFVRVSCEDGSVYECDFVIVTCSLGFLKHNADQLFLPRLPLSKRNAIEVCIRLHSEKGSPYRTGFSSKPNLT